MYRKSFYNLNNRHCEIELHMRSSSEHAHILHGSKSQIGPINVETTFFVLKFIISLLKLKSNDLLPFFSAI